MHTEVIFFATIATADRGKFLSASSLFQKTTQKFMYFLSHFRTESGNTDTFCVIFLVCNRKIYSGAKMYNYVWKTLKSIYALLLHINNCRKLRAFCPISIASKIWSGNFSRKHDNFKYDPFRWQRWQWSRIWGPISKLWSRQIMCYVIYLVFLIICKIYLVFWKFGNNISIFLKCWKYIS